MEKAKIVEAAKALNETGLAEFRVKVVGVSNNEMIKQFLMAVETVPTAKEDDIPENVGEVFNALREEEDAGTLNVRGEQAEEKAAEKADAPKKPAPPHVQNAVKEQAEKKAAEKAEKKAKKEERAAKPKVGTNEFGHRNGSICAGIDQMLKKGATREEIIKGVMVQFGRDERLAENYWKSYSRNMKKMMGYAPKTEKYFIKEQ